METGRVTGSGLAESVEDRNVETLNLVVVGIVVVFSCIMLANTLYAATSYRSREFGQQRLAGATPGQVLRVVGWESVILTLTGLVLGTVAGVAGIIPFTTVRTDQVLPDQGPGTWLAVMAVATVVTLGTSLGTARRTLRTPAIDAVAVAA